MRHIINENGMSIKLVQHCNESETFRKEILKLFMDPIIVDKFLDKSAENIDEIKFTGDTPVGDYDLKPDITIFYKTGERAYIEVKTNKDTGYQGSQKKSEKQENGDKVTEEKNYLNLLEFMNSQIVGQRRAEKQVYKKKYFGYLLDKNHYDTFKKINNSFPTACWNDVYEIVKDFGYRDFERDIRENVDGIITEQEEIKLKPYDISLLYNPKLFNDMLRKLKKIALDFKEKDKKSNNQEPILKYNNTINIKDYVLKGETNYVPNFTFTKDGDYTYLLSTKTNEPIEKMYLGWQSDLLDRTTNFYKENKDEIKEIKDNIKNKKFEDFLYSFSMHKEMLNMKKLNDDKIIYLEDEYGWIYFPIKEDDKDAKAIHSKEYHCDVYAYNLEEQSRINKLNICTSINFSYKIEKVLNKVQKLIIDKLKKYHPDYNFESSNTVEECYRYINYNKEKKIEDAISYGVMTCIFNTDVIEKQAIENQGLQKKGNTLSDYFLSVCIDTSAIPQKQENTVQTSLTNGLSSTKEFHWIFYPINPITLCNDKDLEPFADEVVSIIKKYLDI